MLQKVGKIWWATIVNALYALYALTLAFHGLIVVISTIQV